MEPDPWRRLRTWWSERTSNDRRVLIVVAALTAIIVVIGVAAGSSSGSSSSSSSSTTSTWYSDLGPTGLTSDYVTTYEGETFNMPKPTAAEVTAFQADTGASDPLFGMAICSDVRYGTGSFAATESTFTNTLQQSDARARQYIRASLLDLCPA